MAELSKEEKRRLTREYITRINDYYIEEMALKKQLNLLIERMGPAELPSGNSDGISKNSDLDIMQQFKQLTKLKDEIDDLKEKAVDCELTVIREIYNINEPKYRAILIERYMNRRDIYAISVVYRELGMQNNSTNYIKRVLRKAEELFYEKNLKNRGCT